MSSRIRYVVSDESGDVLRSARNYEVNNMSLAVFLNVDDMTYSIIDENSNKEVVVGSSAASLQMLKKAAKQSLVNVGVTFNPETRTHVIEGNTNSATFR